ncbi:methyltransferase domain-containing protein [Candidatus Woesearchaeota archaeon]|nr:methyltransferase domain-containing protein [Candidatus Woesearchaeota archaeon]
MTDIWHQYTKDYYSFFDETRIALELRYIKINYGLYLPKDKGSKILEIGFGRGSFLAYLEKEGYTNYFGIEIGKQQVDFVKEKVTSKVKLVYNTLDFLKKHKNTYDLIFLSDVIAHIPKEETIIYLQAIQQALNSNGVILLRTPSITNPFCLRSMSNDFTYTTYYSYESVRQVLSLSGFSKIIIKEESFNIGLKGYIYQSTLNLCNFFLRYILILYNRTNNLILSKMMIIIATK